MHFGRFHHVGVATTSIERDESAYSKLGYIREGMEFVDPNQGVRGLFVVGPGPRLELLEQLEGSSALAPWLNSTNRMYHLAYEVDNLVTDLAMAQQELRAHILRPPLPAVAFSGRLVSFIVLRNRAVIELIETGVK